MKISELIAELEALKAGRGDLDVAHSESGYDWHGVSAVDAVGHDAGLGCVLIYGSGEYRLPEAGR